VGLRDIIEQLALGLTLFKRLLVEEVCEVDLRFVVRIAPLPENFPGDADTDDQHKVDGSTLSRRWIQEILTKLGENSTRLQNTTHRSHPPGMSGR
jgi:hypothetical protein